MRADAPLFATVTGEYTHPDNLHRALSGVLAWSNPHPAVNQPRAKKGVNARMFSVQRSDLERRLKVIPVAHRARLEAIIRDGVALPRITPHDLRHTAGTQMLRMKMSLEVVSKVLGHAKVSITLDVYRHVLESETKAEMVDLYPLRPARAIALTPMN